MFLFVFVVFALFIDLLTDKVQPLSSTMKCSAVDDLVCFPPCHLGDAVYVNIGLVVHVGGTRCVTSNTDNIMKIHARITLTVEFIRTCIFLFLFYV